MAKEKEKEIMDILDTLSDVMFENGEPRIVIRATQFERLAEILASYIENK